VVGVCEKDVVLPECRIHKWDLYPVLSCDIQRGGMCMELLMAYSYQNIAYLDKVIMSISIF